MRESRWRGNIDAIRELYEAPYEKRAAPTKLPAGRLELDLPHTMQSAELSLAQATAKITFTDGSMLEAFIHATDCLGFLRYTGQEHPRLMIKAPPFQGAIVPFVSKECTEVALADLGYPMPEVFHTAEGVTYEQACHGDCRFVVRVEWENRDNQWIACWTIVTSAETALPKEVASDRVHSALQLGYDHYLASHEAWWSNYWKASSIALPNQALERQWYLDQYKFGSASRRGAPPITLQGPWTADNGKTPPWKGDYHHDLNTQLSYWSCYAANRLEEGLAYLDWLWDTKDRCAAWTQSYFGCDGLNVPGVADLENKPMGGWAPYSFSATTSCWLAHHFYLHWKYSGDRDFLANRAYPYLREVAIFVEAISHDGDKIRALRLSSSPEINDNRLSAWFPGVTNYDLSLMRWLLSAAGELATELAIIPEAKRWQTVLEQMPELATGAQGEFLVAPGHPLTVSHRHFSHLMAIHPLRIVDWNRSREDRDRITASLAQLETLGTSQWCGYSFAWVANFYALAQEGEKAERALEIFQSAFTLRNSFHCNGDQSGKNYSNFRERPFTLEGNFAAAAAIQEMLLQSSNGILRIFPAIPSTWRDVVFSSLRAEGGFLVSAIRENGNVKAITIESDRDQICKWQNPFSGRIEEFHVMPSGAVRLESPLNI